MGLTVPCRITSVRSLVILGEMKAASESLVPASPQVERVLSWVHASQKCIRMDTRVEPTAQPGRLALPSKSPVGVDDPERVEGGVHDLPGA